MVTTSSITYRSDGLTLTGRLAVPDGAGPRPGVLIAHEGPGLDPIQLERADRLADLGYIAFALDYHGDLTPFADRDAMRSRLDELSAEPDRVVTLGRAGLDILLAEPTVDPGRVAAIGYCYGGTVVLELARDGAALEAVVGFHPRVRTIRPASPGAVRGSVLICVGSEDPLVPPEDLRAFEEEMRVAGADWQVQIHGGAAHSFTHPQADQAGIAEVAYDPKADQRSWRAMLDLFDEALAVD